MSYKFYRVLNSFISEEDTVLIPSRPVDFIYFISLLKKRKIGLTLAMDIRDIWPDSYNKNSFVFNAYCNFFLRRSVKYFDNFFHISPSFADWLVRYKPDGISTFVPPGFNWERWRHSTPKKLSKLYPLRLVFIGALQYQLDILPIIKAIGNDSNYVLTIIGEDGKGQRSMEVLHYIKSHHISNVFLKGVVDPVKVPTLLEEAHVGLIPMISNSMTNKLFDYIAAYLPVFVLGNNDTSNFIKTHGIGWSTSFEFSEIKETLGSITLQDVNSKIENLALIRNSYNRDILYKKIVEILVPSNYTSDASISPEIV